MDQIGLKQRIGTAVAPLLVLVMVAIDKAGQSVDLSVDDGIWRLHNTAAALACT